MDLIVVFVMVVERSRGMVSEVFGRRLVSRVLISQVLLLSTGGLRLSTLPYPLKSVFSTFPFFTRIQACASDGGLMRLRERTVQVDRNKTRIFDGLLA